MTIHEPSLKLRHRKIELPIGTAEVWLEKSGDKVDVHMESVRVHGSGGSHGHWHRCDVQGCLGEVVQGTKCMRHLDPQNREAFLKSLSGTTKQLSLRGVEVDQRTLDAVLRPPVFVDGEILFPLSFSAADISASLRFTDCTFHHHFDLSGAIVRAPFSVKGCEFRGQLHAAFTYFNAGPPSFNNSVFRSVVYLSHAHTQRVSIGFSNSEFLDHFRADGIDGALLVEACEFKKDVVASGAAANVIRLNDCSIAGELDLEGAKCGGLHAERLQALGVHRIGPLDVGHCVLKHARFAVPVLISTRGRTLDLTGATFAQGGVIRASEGRLVFSQLTTDRHIRVVGDSQNPPLPALVGIDDARAGAMSFAHVDMRRCVYYGAHDLPSVGIEPTCLMMNAPARWHARRRCVADEFAWRSRRAGFWSSSWRIEGTRLEEQVPTDENEDAVVLPNLKASQVAAVYRALRRSYEAKSDEPGAADFYYGEMEMRRYSEEAGFAERLIITLYWLTSGYGLRASRSFGLLTLLVVASSLLMVSSGFATEGASFIDGLLFSLRAVIPGLRNSDTLTIAGSVFELVLALFGPLLFALGLLALRGRVKR